MDFLIDGQIPSFFPDQSEGQLSTLRMLTTQTRSIFIKLYENTYCRHAKGKSIVNFYVVNALGQNLASSESYAILRLLYEAKICNFR